MTQPVTGGCWDAWQSVCPLLMAAVAREIWSLRWHLKQPDAQEAAKGSRTQTRCAARDLGTQAKFVTAEGDG